MTDEVLTAFRHDVHKFTGESHKDAHEEFAGELVNQSVPEGADGDAAALSRPQQNQEQTVPTHDDHYRLSLLTGETPYDPGEFSRATIESEVADLVGIEDAQTAHERWLASSVAAAFNESVYHPYTSLKYHTLLVAALLDNYRAGYEFADLRLIVDPADEVVPFRTVFDGEQFALRIDAKAAERPSARLGSHPWRSWVLTWNRLTSHPLDTDHDKYGMTLDANLRRIQSWSTALQYIEDFAEWRPDRSSKMKKSHNQQE
ncbi:hypothetical protein [Halorubrum sp. GN11GM_10-3_MGM]|uniref:hypothetical protein n=1 Tax=Halorubrum sp. GN11GM_10-3_MGM TaxID=2518111 RepID=UPI0010F8C81B|nr:hypothetical protein [Halorubrum sp. GN11GM_10-3_MGM]TKX69180.1 hypothetical protein EXE40_11085 [Halorubrum sp. GN11GM_10-3_MGM]